LAFSCSILRLPFPSFIITFMDAFFLDPDVKRLPPESTRLLDLRADPYPDGGRIRVGLELTPFQKRPEIELTLTDPSGQSCATATVIEPMGWKLELTLHIRTGQPEDGIFTLAALLAYPDLGEVDRRSITFEIPQSGQPPALQP